MSLEIMNENSTTNEDSGVHVDMLQICGVDFNLLHILENVFEYLSDKDLTAVYCVNKTWSTVVRKTKKADRRREKYLNDIKSLKEKLGEENWPIKRPPLEPRLLEPRLAFSDIKNTKRKVSQTEDTPSNLIGSRSAAVISSMNTNLRRKTRLKRAIFTPMRGCDVKCLPLKSIENPTYLFAEETKVNEVLVGSKLSKRNLKRL